MDEKSKENRGQGKKVPDSKDIVQQANESEKLNQEHKTE